MNIKNNNLKKGFTAIELMIVVLIMGILAALAGPSIDSWLGSIKAQSKANGILSGISKARGEAISRNLPIVFQVNTTGYWQYGCVTVNADTTSSTYCPSTVLEKADSLISDSKITIAITPSASGYIVFSNLGIGIDNSTYGPARLTNINVTSGVKLYNIVVRSGGSPKMCVDACV